MSKIATVPIQARTANRGPGTVRREVYMMAYEVYCHVFSPQPAMVEGGCRGGFGVGELAAFLYAHSFPREEWGARVDEAFEGMNL